MDEKPLTVDEEYAGYRIQGVRRTDENVVEWNYTISKAGQILFRYRVTQENIWRDTMTASMTVGEVGLEIVRNCITKKKFKKGGSYQEVI